MRWFLKFILWIGMCQSFDAGFIFPCAIIIYLERCCAKGPPKALPNKMDSETIMYLRKISKRNKRNEENLEEQQTITHERTPRIYVIWPLAYIHGWWWEEKFTNKYGRYKISIEAFTKPKLQYTKELSLTNNKEYINSYSIFKLAAPS